MVSLVITPLSPHSLTLSSSLKFLRSNSSFIVAWISFFVSFLSLLILFEDLDLVDSVIFRLIDRDAIVYGFVFRKSKICSDALLNEHRVLRITNRNLFSDV